MKEENIQELMLLPDEVIYNAEKFGFKKYVKTLVRLIAGKEVKTPITIAIHGAWGSGKSSLLRTMVEVLSDERTFNKYFEKSERFDVKKSKIIWFNAWEYEQEDNLAIVLLQHLANELEKGNKTKNLQKLRKFAKIVGKIVLDCTLEKIGGMPLSEIKEHMAKYGDKIEEIATLPNLFRETLMEYFENDMHDYEQIIIFIDDLDRCSIENSKNVIDTIRLFLSTENCIFMLGVDIEKLQTSLDFVYGKYLKFNAREYLEKIIQLRFELPPLSINEVKDYIKRNLPEDFKAEYIDIIAEGVSANPRNIKLFINNLRLQLMLSKYQDFKVIIPLLIEWVVIRHSFPKFAEEIEAKPRLLLEYHNEEAIKKYYGLKEENEKIEFITSKGIKEEFIKNNDLIRFLKANKHKFNIPDIEKIILQTQLTPSNIEQTWKHEVGKAKAKYVGSYLSPILRIKKITNSLLSSGASERILSPLIKFYSSYIEDFQRTLKSIEYSKNETEINESIMSFIELHDVEFRLIISYVKGIEIETLDIDKSKKMLFYELIKLLSQLGPLFFAFKKHPSEIKHFVED